jgi:hypothetical protein
VYISQQRWLGTNCCKLTFWVGFDHWKGTIHFFDLHSTAAIKEHAVVILIGYLHSRIVTMMGLLAVKQGNKQPFVVTIKWISSFGFTNGEEGSKLSPQLCCRGGYYLATKVIFCVSLCFIFELFRRVANHSTS